jgi:hypothetical protein
MTLGPVDEHGQLLHPVEEDDVGDPTQNLGRGGKVGPSLTGLGDDPNNVWGLRGWQWDVHDFGAWGYGGCTVPYVFDASMSPEFRDAFRDGVAFFDTFTYCRWEERTDANHYVVVSYSDNLGDGIKGQSDIGRDCIYRIVPGSWLSIPTLQCNSPTRSLKLQSSDYRTVVHEMYHILGFFHEHQRPDRDTYVDVDGSGPDFDVFNWDSNHELYAVNDYDTGSILHYQGHCTWYNFFAFCGYWGCWGNVLPKGLHHTFDCSNRPAGETVSVGGDAPDYGDIQSVLAVYPPPPYVPPPAVVQPPAVNCNGFPYNACLRGSTSACCP